MQFFANKVLVLLSRQSVLGILIFLVSFLVRWLALTQTDFGNGWDSYFYFVQIKSILVEGKMHSPEWTLFYPLLLFVNFFSPDVISSVKILSGLLAGLFSLLIYLYALRFSPHKEVALLLAAITWFSPELTYFTAQWPKNLLGVDLLLALLLAMDHDKKGLVLVLFILGLFGHRMTALLGLGCVIFWLVNKYLSPRVWLAVGLGLIALVLITSLAPGIINLKDYQRIQNLISTTPHFAVISFISSFGMDKISIYWLLELIAAGILIFLLLARESYFLIKKNKTNGLMIVLLIVILWFPFYLWEISGAAYRLFHVGVLITPLFLLFLIRDLEFKKTIAIATIALFCVLSFVSWKSYDPQKQDPPYSLYSRVTKALDVIVKNQRPELIIAHKSLAEFFTYSTGIDAMPWLPDYKIESAKLWRIAVLPYEQLFIHYTNSNPVHLGGRYYYVAESQWQSYIEQLRKNESADLLNAHLTWQNPNEVRPEFLRKKN